MAIFANIVNGENMVEHMDGNLCRYVLLVLLCVPQLNISDDLFLNNIVLIRFI